MNHLPPGKTFCEWMGRRLWDDEWAAWKWGNTEYKSSPLRGLCDRFYLPCAESVKEVMFKTGGSRNHLQYINLICTVSVETLGSHSTEGTLKL